jgi:hypothetical protein
VTTLTVSLIPPLTTGSTEVGTEDGVVAANTGSQVAAGVGESNTGTGPAVPIQGASDDTDDQTDATAGQPATPESNFGLGIEEKLRQLELRKKDDGSKPDGPSSRRGLGEWLPGQDVAVFWQEADADWLSDMPLEAWPAADEMMLSLPASAAFGGGKELPPFADDPGPAVWLSLPDEVVEAVRQTGLSRQDREQPVGGTDPAPVEVLVRTAREEAGPEALAALVMAGLACWVEKMEKTRTASASLLRHA